jgi:hypothetical protein
VRKKVGERHLVILCDAYLEGLLGDDAVSYVATALELCPDYRIESGLVREVLFLLSDSDINGPLTPDRVRELRSRLLAITED